MRACTTGILKERNFGGLIELKKNVYMPTVPFRFSLESSKVDPLPNEGWSISLKLREQTSKSLSSVIGDSEALRIVSELPEVQEPMAAVPNCKTVKDYGTIRCRSITSGLYDGFTDVVVVADSVPRKDRGH